MRARGRSAGSRSLVGMGARRQSSLLSLAAVAPLFLLAACGGSLTTPDLATGEITGTLSSVGDPAQAHAYVVGHPETLAKVGADGSYTLSKVPVGDARVVFFDGKDRAGVVEGVRVESAKRSSLAKDARELPLASRVVVVTRGGAGVKGNGAAITLEDTIFQDRVSTDGKTVELFPVPQGTWRVRGKLKGFKDKPGSVAVDAGVTKPLEVEIDELDDTPEHGCKSSVCSDGLQCEGDGRCYACTSDADCGGLKCESHVCVGATVGARHSCEPCSSNSDCEGPGGTCLSAGSGVSGLCASAPSSSGCKSGYAVGNLNGSTVCAPPSLFAGHPILEACSRVVTAFGASCLSDANCQQDLAGGVCQKPAGAGPLAPGVCTATCSSNGDCPSSVSFGRCNPQPNGAISVCGG
jgi:hypothetical protein